MKEELILYKEIGTRICLSLKIYLERKTSNNYYLDVIQNEQNKF